MKITKITVEFDNGSHAEYENSKGFDLSDVSGMLGLSLGDIADPKPDTWQAALQSLASVAISALMKRFGL